MLDLNKEIKYIKGVGPARAELLNKVGIFNLQDLITYFPRGYEDRSKPRNIQDVEDGEEALIEAICVSKMLEKRVKKNMTIYKLTVRDETGGAVQADKPLHQRALGPVDVVAGLDEDPVLRQGTGLV